ncbi:hypothetical protein GCWU000341_02561 [Oribacterium sp. oral taxon 078 str. F0262]|nr:hypothetical protein GCWU000341_02561 [Oribacterium sp. oral taxon 078 str. F0262]
MRREAFGRSGLSPAPIKISTGSAFSDDGWESFLDQCRMRG